MAFRLAKLVLDRHLRDAQGCRCCARTTPRAAPPGSTSTPAKDTFLTDPGRCPVTHVVLDSGLEQKVAQVLESLPQVAAYVKNDHLGFVIPYTLDGEQRSYLPDFLVRARVADGETPLTLVVEVSGATRRDKTEKVRTARDLWVPSVNAHGGFGR